jgi:calcium-dependent protein kinase
LKLIFQQLDFNADGKLSKNEILYVLKSEMELEKAAEVVEVIFNNGDSDKNGFLEYSEFLRAAIQRENLLTDENIEKAFKMIDSSGDGIVTHSEFQDSFGYDLPPGVVQELLLLIDPDKTGKITFCQFREFLRDL